MRAWLPLRNACAAAIVLLALGAAARGGDLEADPNALSSWQGSTNMYNSFFTILSVNANVDFAVYEPGKFTTSFPGAAPIGGSEYVYAYQIFNLTTDSSPVTALTVGLDGDEPFNTGANIGFVASTGDVSPSASYLVAPSDGSLPPTSARWAFSVLPVGKSSDVLYFTSPAVPEAEGDSATVTGSWPATEKLPSPVPEPTTVGVLALGALAVLIRKQRARQ
ncbi:hypothetical protein LCGC14_0489820 [marine sediment metagenome]|uniref:Ice-binding protein C-terminal domain-containing protein n=1 Tax=marine sediment metagenome TaxID=412755 RepID=A0A0F9S6U9_9ZZZZ